MTTILSLLLSLVFIFLAFIHFYWLFGGNWGLKQAVPTKNEKEDFSPPPRLATFLVAIVLVLFGFLYIVQSGFINIQLSDWIIKYVYWIIPSVFLLRAIGEFRYVGFFKKIKNTDFAKADSNWFSPLCCAVAIIGFIIQLMQ